MLKWFTNLGRALACDPRLLFLVLLRRSSAQQLGHINGGNMELPTLNPKLETRSPALETLNPKLELLNPKP